ncbi:MAG: FAD-dependent oxidoreductase [Chloracidobacterium sp.]|uniref:FAD-dependent oxidoreductase n=1 Tax=Chloracidobacterium validum TaxID=2821543 RepID=A0ABX8B564_9BACT|nr:FAD-dependent oxidoreductase [Chloracidobacterium validum]QUW02112.1 FAD-dependent oxidoreductase [Chloracidobacterium validum]
MAEGSNQTELLIVGGGPAGIAAALWGKRLGLEPLLLEASAQLGGQLLRSYNRSVDCPGFYGLVGADIAERLTVHLLREGVRFKTDAPVTNVDCATRRAIIEGGEAFVGDALVLALGVRKRWLGVPGEREFVGRGVSTSATRDKERYAGKPVIIVGGGDGACEEALMLDQAGCQVTLVHRSATFRARPLYRDRVLQHPRIRVMTHTRLLAIEGQASVERVITETSRPGESPFQTTLSVAGVFLALGVVAGTELIAGQLACDADGYILTDRHGATSCAGVWACGDTTRPLLSSLSTAFGDGATVAKAAFDWLMLQKE